jgi:TP901 family phage tail tape measure protein
MSTETQRTLSFKLVATTDTSITRSVGSAVTQFRQLEGVSAAVAREMRQLSLAETEAAKARLVNAAAAEKETRASRSALQEKEKEAKATVQGAEQGKRAIAQRTAAVLQDINREIAAEKSRERAISELVAIDERNSQRRIEAAKKAADAEIAEAKRATTAAQTAESERRQRAQRIIGGAQVIGQGLTTGVSVPLLSAATFSLKTAIDQEEAFTEVKKFVQGSTGELDKLKEEIRELSLDAKVGLDFTQLSHLAAFGGQLGIARKDLAEFVRQVAYLGQAGDMSGEEAATGLAKIAAAMKLGTDQIPHLASALAEMGNLGSSTVQEIEDVSKRIASTANTVGISAPQVLGFANAVTSLGQNAEAAGTALNKTFNSIDRAVALNTPKLKIFADVAGMTAKQFADTWRNEPVKAILAFVTGLDHIKGKSGEVTKALDAAGVKGDRFTTVLKNLAAGHDLLSDAIQHSTEAYTGHNVAEEKAAIAAQSTKRQLEQLKHEAEDAANELGESLLPALRDVMNQTKPLREEIKSLADEFHALSPEAQSAWTKVALGVALVGPVIQGAASIAGAILKIRDAYLALAGAEAVAAGAGGAGAAGGGLGLGARIASGTGVAGFLGTMGLIVGSGVVGAGIGTAINDTFIGSNDRAGDRTNAATSQMEAERGPAFQKFIALQRKHRDFVGTLPGGKPQTITQLRLLRSMESELASARVAAMHAANPEPTPPGASGGSDTGGGVDLSKLHQDEAAAGGKSKKSQAEKDAEAAARDAAGAAGVRQGEVEKTLRDGLKGALENLRGRVPEGSISTVRSGIGMLLDQIQAAAEESARTKYAKSVAGDPKNTRTAQATLQADLSDAARARKDASKEVDDAEKDAYKRVAAKKKDAADKEEEAITEQIADARKRAEELKKFQESEVRMLEYLRDGTEDAAGQIKLTDLIFKRQMEMAQGPFGQFLISGDPNDLLEGVAITSQATKTHTEKVGQIHQGIQDAQEEAYHGYIGDIADSTQRVLDRPQKTNRAQEAARQAGDYLSSQADEFGRRAGEMLIEELFTAHTRRGGAKEAFKQLGKEAGASIASDFSSMLVRQAEKPIAQLGTQIGKALFQNAGGMAGKVGTAIGLAAVDAMVLSHANKRKKTGFGIGAVLGGIGGFLAGGPQGALYGAEIGGAIGGSFAAGGTAPRGKISLFGENGPELGIPKTDMHIFDHAKSKGILESVLGVHRGGSGGGNPVHMYIQDYHEASDYPLVNQKMRDQQEREQFAN